MLLLSNGERLLEPVQHPTQQLAQQQQARVAQQHSTGTPRRRQEVGNDNHAQINLTNILRVAG